MADSFFFYDLETSGFSAQSARIMQFAGVRTDMNLVPIGEPVDMLIKLAPDVLPSPDAIFVTGITPQQTITDGATEAEFLKFFYQEVVRPGTIFTGFNSVRFDDEFMRFLNYRNFYDAYEWQWKDNRSRWDILDLVRITRALRPDGIEWPVDSDGKATNRLELLTKANGLDHEKAHDALNDVYATIAVAKRIKEAQPELFAYVLGMRDKRKVAQLVETGQPFVYTSGRYPGEYAHTTVSVLVAKHHEQAAAHVYDLRHDPTPFVTLSAEALAEAWKFTRDPDALRLPVKTLKYNRCPAIAPLGVIKDEATQERIALPLSTVQKHLAILRAHQDSFAKNLQQAAKILDDQRDRERGAEVLPADARLYEGFIAAGDKQLMDVIRQSPAENLSGFAARLSDDRLRELLPLYKARNYPSSLSDEERQAWEAFCAKQLFDGGSQSKLAQYFARLSELSEGELTSQQEYLLEELQLYGQSIVPAELD